jgi:hypothetical protein
VTWAAIWFVLVTAAAVFLTLVGLRLFRQAKAHTADLTAAADRFATALQPPDATARTPSDLP